MILHIINKAPNQSACFSYCLESAGKDDSVVLIEDGVYLLTSPSTKIETLTIKNIYYLQSDLQARGLTNLTTLTANPIDYSGFVDLVCQHSKSVSWF